VVSARTRSSFNHVRRHGLSKQRFVQLSTLLAAAGGDFMRVVGCGTASLMPMRQKRRQARLSVTSAHSVSKPSRYRKRRNIMRRYVSMGIDAGRSWMEEGDERSKNTGRRAGGPPAPALAEAQKFGREIASHSVCWRLLCAQQRWLQSLRKGDWAIVASFGPEREHPPNTNALVTAFSHRLFQVEVATERHTPNAPCARHFHENLAVAIVAS